MKYLDKDVLSKLGKAVFTKKLPSSDRWGLQNDLYALVKAGDSSIDEYTGFLSHYIHEHSFLPLMSIAQNLFHAYMVLQDDRKKKVESIGKSLFEKVLSEIGYNPTRDEEHTISILRDQLIWYAVLYGSREVEHFALTQFGKLMQGETIHPDIMKSVMQVGALNAKSRVFEWFDGRLNSSNSEHERMNILMALGSFSDRALIEKAQHYILDKVPNRNKFVPIVSMAANPHATPLMWNWFRAQLGVLELFHPFHYERVVASVIPVCGLGREEEATSFFSNYMAQKGLARDAIKLSLERLRVNSRMRQGLGHTN